MRKDKIEMHPLWRLTLDKFMEEMAVGCIVVESGPLPRKDARIIAKKLADIFDDGKYYISVADRCYGSTRKKRSVIIASQPI